MNRRELSKIHRIARLRRFRKEELIFSKQQSGSSLFIVVAGGVKIYAVSRTGRTKTFAFLKRGDFFGEMALLNGKIRSASAQAMRDTELLMLHKRDFRRLLQSESHLTLKVLRTLSERLRRANQEIESLTFQNVLGRVIGVLLDLSRRHGKKTAQGVLIRLEMTQQELADLTGTARELITRALGTLRKTGCIENQDNHLLIRDPNKMRSFLA